MNKRKILIIVAILFILIGTILLCFPSASNYIYEKNVETEKEKFVVKITDEQNENILDKLYKKLQEENQKIYEEKQKDTDCCDSTFFNRNSCICRIWCLEKVQRYFDAEPGGTDAPDNQNPE